MFDPRLLAPMKRATLYHTHQKGKSYAWLAILAIVVATTMASLLSLRTPEAVKSVAPFTQFSSERAMIHLQQIAQRPHPVGSEDHDRVRDYLMDQLRDRGLTPEIQHALAVNSKWGNPIAGNVDNILAKLKGENSSGAVMLVAHYDSAFGGPGAGDDGSAVASILETIRVLQETGSLRNDVIILFTDAEELGLLGAQAFMSEHPWAKEVALVLNFEARGNYGPSVLFETSDQNGWITKEFAQFAKYPLGSSLLYSLYKTMPNDTDMSVFKEAGMNGLNFALGFGLNAYHTSQDTVDNMNESSVQHQGEYMVSLTRHFGALDLSVPEVKQEDRVYFQSFGNHTITYSNKWVIPLTVVVLVMFLAVLIYGLYTLELTWLGVLGGTVLFPLSLLIVYGVIKGIWSVLISLFPEQKWYIYTSPEISHYYFIALITITIGLMLLIYNGLASKMRLTNLAVGAFILWALVNVGVSLYLPGASYVFVWSMLFGVIGLYGMLRTSSTGFLNMICIIPGILLFVPVLYMIYMMITLQLAEVILVLVAMLFGLFIPLVPYFRWKNVVIVPVTLIIVGSALIFGMSLKEKMSADFPRVNDVKYYYDEDAQQALWATPYEVDAYSAQFLSGEVTNGNISDRIPAMSGPAYYSVAPLYSVDVPEVRVVSDETAGLKRSITFEVKTPISAQGLLLKLSGDLTLYKAVIDGRNLIDEEKFLEGSNPWSISYSGAKGKSFQIQLVISSGNKLRLNAVTMSSGLPKEAVFNKKSRSAYSNTSTYGDSTYVIQTYEF